MKFLYVQWIAITLLFMAVSEAQAARRDFRQGAQRARIREGVESGSLTKGETARARAGQRRIRRMEHRAEADGQVTAAEKAKIEQAQDSESRKIYRMKNNEKNRAEAPGAPFQESSIQEATSPAN